MCVGQQAEPHPEATHPQHPDPSSGPNKQTDGSGRGASLARHPATGPAARIPGARARVQPSRTASAGHRPATGRAGRAQLDRTEWEPRRHPNDPDPSPGAGRASINERKARADRYRREPRPGSNRGRSALTLACWFAESVGTAGWGVGMGTSVHWAQNGRWATRTEEWAEQPDAVPCVRPWASLIPPTTAFQTANATPSRTVGACLRGFLEDPRDPSTARHAPDGANTWILMDSGCRNWRGDPNSRLEAWSAPGPGPGLSRWRRWPGWPAPAAGDPVRRRCRLRSRHRAGR